MATEPNKPWDVVVLTTSRADFSIYQPVLRALEAHPDIQVSLLVTGMHMSEDFGYTFTEVEKSGWPIAAHFECLVPGDTAKDIGLSMGRATQGMANALEAIEADILVVLGDRFEMAAAALAAVPRGLPICHLHGGEETEGAMDNVLRHMLTKISHLHCCATELAASRIRQMGEPPDRVIVSGAPALDNIAVVPRLSRRELAQQFGLPESGDFALITYHPVTLDLAATETEIAALFEVIKETDIHCVFTAANADTAGRALNAKIEKFVAENEGQMLIGHMGAKGYYSAMEHAAMMIGNSSSGILEAASFGLPVVNIGDRQKGREVSPNIITAKGTPKNLIAAITKARTADFKALCAKRENIYGDGHAADKIVGAIARFLKAGHGPRKVFHEVIS
ncbi:UDP-N-acetylglucosamine 2-epimerase [Hellea balneolensis]|uniref:UDP-N-acetylglucosamine 2-epimerase n=1 Tax=Hellea balneolensis TaxID=287478 RepID=UPI0004061ACA|nr:UDP-N-acetylglucosamine 2-epimerase [Hellea balneolensis]